MRELWSFYYKSLSGWHRSLRALACGSGVLLRNVRVEPSTKRQLSTAISKHSYKLNLEGKLSVSTQIKVYIKENNSRLKIWKRRFYWKSFLVLITIMRKQIINSKSVKATAYKQENRYLFHNQHYSAVLNLNVNNSKWCWKFNWATNLIA